MRVPSEPRRAGGRRFYTYGVEHFRSRKQARTSSRYPLLLFWNRLPLLCAAW